MTEESYLPPDADRPSRSEIIACEPNPAQQSDRYPLLTAAGAILLIGRLALSAGGAGRHEVSLVIIGLIVILAGGALAVYETILKRRFTRRRLEDLSALYPDSRATHYATVILFRPQIGCDGRKHHQDLGFMTIEDDCLRWRGAWFQFQLRRQDIRSVVNNSGILSADRMLQVRRDTFGDIRSVVVKELPHGKLRLTLVTTLRLRDWHKTGKRL